MPEDKKETPADWLTDNESNLVSKTSSESSQDAHSTASTPSIESAMQDIDLAETSDQLQAESEQTAEKDGEFASDIETEVPVSRLQKIKRFIRDWWNDPKKRNITLVVAGCTVLLIGLLPGSRYFVLNTVGVRSAASLTVRDESTGQPLRNVKVSLANKEGKTDENGNVRLEKLKLGRSKLLIQKSAFATADKTITVGWGSNPLGEYKLKPVGIQYSFNVTDFLSGKAIEKAEAVSGDYSAFANADGKAVLTIDDTKQETIEVTIKAKDYRDEVLSLDAGQKEPVNVVMAAARKHVFVSKRSGKFDVYSSGIDGKHEELVLSGTGSEREDIALAPHPGRDVAALVSTRGNTRNVDGFLLSTLTLIDLGRDSVATTPLGQSEKFQVIGWVGDYLVYVQIASGASAANPNRHRLITYNYVTQETKELASSNYFNDIVLINDDIYYAPSAAYAEGEQTTFNKIKASGEKKTVIFDKEVWSVFRTGYNTLAFAVQNDWYELNLKDQKMLRIAGAPAVQQTRVYVDDAEKKQSVWIDMRDGKGVLVKYDVEQDEEEAIRTQSGLTYPVRWMGAGTLVYRVNNGQEIADYALSLNGGEPKKISDVTNTTGTDRWYYY